MSIPTMNYFNIIRFNIILSPMPRFTFCDYSFTVSASSPTNSTCSPSHLALSNRENFATSIHGEQYKRRISYIQDLDPLPVASILSDPHIATGHLDTSFSRFPCAYKQMLRWFPTFQVATTCVSCRPPDLNLLVSNFIFCIHVK